MPEGPQAKRGLERLEPDDVAHAMDRLAFGRPNLEGEFEGPPADSVVSGRAGSAGGPHFSGAELCSPRELGLLLDEDFIDELLLAEEGPCSMPAEAVLGTIVWTEEPGEDPRVLFAEAVQTEDDAAKESDEWFVVPAESAPARFLPDTDPVAHAQSEPARFSPDTDSVAHARSVPVRFSPDTGPVVPPRFLVELPLGHPRASAPRPPAAALEREPPRKNDEAASRSPVVAPVQAGLASLALPGWGQAMNAQRGKAWAFRISAFATLLTLVLCLLRGPLATLFGLRIAGGVALAPLWRPQALWARLLAEGMAPWLMGVMVMGALLWLLSAYDAVVVRACARRCAR